MYELWIFRSKKSHFVYTKKINFKNQYVFPYNKIIFKIWLLCLYNSSINKCRTSILKLVVRVVFILVL